VNDQLLSAQAQLFEAHDKATAKGRKKKKKEEGLRNDNSEIRK
jgi:hypothetical protein